MGIEETKAGSWTDSFHQYRDEMITKIKKGATEESIAMGGSSFTRTEWEKTLESIDKQIEEGKKEQKQRLEKQKEDAEETAEALRAYEAAISGKGNWQDEKIPGTTEF